MPVHVQTYPDGSKRYGMPPFPKRSPLEQARGIPEPEPDVVSVDVPVLSAPKRRGRKPKAKTE